MLKGVDLVNHVVWFSRTVRLDILVPCYLFYKFHRMVYIFLRCLPRDLRYFWRVKQILKTVNAMRAEDETVYSAFEKLAISRPHDVCFYYEDEIWTYRSVQDFADRVAQVASADGFKKGDTIALVMGNRPEYLCIRVGLSQLGVITALVNTHLRNRPLAYSIVIVSAKGAIVESEFAQEFDDIKKAKLLWGCEKMYQYEGKLLPNWEDLKARMEAAPAGRPAVADPPHHDDTNMYVYSSGTTGLPKACIITHSKTLLGPVAFTRFVGLKPEKDVLYTSMPLYHLAGGGYGVGNALVCGIPVAISRRFSASRFWQHCIKYNATAAQYIGEMCRFLMSQPPQPTDTEHKVRRLIGNGLRPSLWRPFQERFKVPVIVEVYGATESNSNILNSTDNTVGVVGFVPRIIPLSRQPNALIRVDRVTEELKRGPDGFCQRCNIGEPGLFIGVISDSIPGRSFEGYVDRMATRRKIIHNVFKRGDKWFNSGDLLVMDEFGYLSFVDRCGDTFRWKGENVAAAEVEEMIKALLPNKEVAVYGVEIPGNEGKCGMAAIEDRDGTVDQDVLDDLASGLNRSVAPYARPLFIRIMEILPVTGTYKVTKNALQLEGYDISRILDPVYFLDPKTARYVRMLDDIHRDVITGYIRV